MQTDLPFHPARILCPLDFSALSDLALKYAAAGARAFDATLVVFHARRFEVPAYFTPAQMNVLARQQRAERDQINQFLRQHARKVLGAAADALRIKYDSTDAHPVDAVLAAGKKHRADLIVIGTHGRGGAKRLWLGSVAENVVHHADAPVFVVRQKQHDFIDPADPGAGPRLATILCPVNFSPVARTALGHAVSLAKQFQARLVTSCIVEPDAKASVATIRQELSGWLAEAGVGDCPVEAVARKGRAAEQIVTMATQAKADLVVLGAQRRGALRSWLWGDTTELVLRHAPAPVLVVPA